MFLPSGDMSDFTEEMKGCYYGQTTQPIRRQHNQSDNMLFLCYISQGDESP